MLHYLMGIQRAYVLFMICPISHYVKMVMGSIVKGTAIISRTPYLNLPNGMISIMTL